MEAEFAVGGPAGPGHPHWDQDEVHDVYRAWRRLTDAYPGERTFVGEVWVATPAQLARYLRPDELHTAFNFGFLLARWDAGAMREAIDESIHELAKVGAPPTWVLSNHDVDAPRQPLRRGRGRSPSARAAALLMLALPGGAYVYQGEELGLPRSATCPTSCAKTRPTPARGAPRRDETVVGCPSPGPATRHRSGSGRPAPGCPNRPSGPRSPWSAKQATRRRCSRCTARPCGSGGSTRPWATGQ